MPTVLYGCINLTSRTMLCMLILTGLSEGQVIFALLKKGFVTISCLDCSNIVNSRRARIAANVLLS
jgi:hypothetical protein